MGIEQEFHLDTRASRHELRDVLVRAEIGLTADLDYEHISHAQSDATLVSVIERDDPALGSGQSLRPDNGVVATRSVYFSLRDRSSRLGNQYDVETVRGVMALLKAFSEANAYLLLYDAALPALLYKNGRLVLAQQLTRDRELWDAEHQPYRALVDMPYTIEPLGPWRDVPIEKR